MRKILTVLNYLDDNIEKFIVILSYTMMTSIVFIEVVRRMVFNVQSSWSVQIPIFLFLFVTWFSAAYNAKVRSHLCFTGLRDMFSPRFKLLCHILDYISWIVLGAFVIYFTFEQVLINKNNFSFILGTDIPTWYFMVSTPLGWSLILYRVTQNLFYDIKAYRNHCELKKSNDYFGGTNG